MPPAPTPPVLTACRYAFLQKVGANPSTDPWYIVTLSLVDAHVTAAAVGCATLTVCPWSLEYLSLVK